MAPKNKSLMLRYGCIAIAGLVSSALGANAILLSSTVHVTERIVSPDHSQGNRRSIVLDGRVFTVAERQGTPRRRLNASELRSVLSKGMSFRWRRRKTVGTVVYRSDGSTTITWKSPSSSGRSSGQWRLSGDKLCRRWNKIRGAREECGHVYQRADGVYVTSEPSGGYRGVARP